MPIIVAAVVLAAGVILRADAAILLRRQPLSTYWGGNNYFADQKELGSNLTMVSCDHYGFQPTLVRAALDSAGACGLNAILLGEQRSRYRLPTTARPMTRGDLTSK